MDETTLKPHQRQALSDLEAKNGRAIVVAKVGAGKTPIAVEFLKRHQVKRALILVSKSIVGQWKKEIIKFGGNPAWEVVNYEKLLDDVWLKKVLSDLPEAVVADEIIKIKSPVGKMSRRFRMLKTLYRIGLCANPLPNSLAEMWSYLQWFQPGLLGESFWRFRNTYAVCNPHIPQQILAFRDPDFLLRTFNRWVVGVVWTGEGELPAASREIVRVALRPDELKRYRKLEETCILELKSGRLTVPNILAKLTKEIQLVNDPPLFGLAPGAKEEALCRVLSESTAKTIIFSEHSQVLKRLQSRLGGELYIGSMNSAAREAALSAFRGEGGRFLWASSAGAMGLNCQYAARVVHYGLPFTNDRLVQRFGRINRIGQISEVSEVILFADGTADERIWRIVNAKKRLEDKFTKSEFKEMVGL